ncbi:MAG: cation-translocating P-type ATPase [Candidatus Woesearchaeota archaeon]
MQNKEHKISIDELFRKLNTSESGIGEKDARDRLKEHGKNVLETKKKVSPIVKFFLQFTNFFALLLLVGSGLAFFAESVSPGQGNLYIGIALVGVVFLNAIFTFIQQYQSEKIMESFKKMLPSKVTVIRDGKQVELETADLVPGDIIYIAEGDKVPADARLIEANLLKVDNSSITGESEPQLRKIECTSDNILESRNVIFSGTMIQSGNGHAVVFGTGMDTQIGKIVQLTKDTKEVVTPLQKEIRHFIKIISNIALVLGFVFFLVSLFLGQQFIGSLIFAIGIIVANVPEGLLPTVTLSLSRSAKKMAKRNALIKNLESVETLGSTTVICTDKTGTITQNKMTVNTLVLNFEEKNIFEKGIKQTPNLDRLLSTMSLCNNARPSKKGFSGDPTESCLLDFSRKYTKLNDMIRASVRLSEIPFDSKTKRMITLNKDGKKTIAHLKGAPEVVLGKCDKIYDGKKTRKLSPKDKEKVLKYYEKLASRGERVLAFAQKQAKEDKVSEKGFTYVGLVGIIDPPRKEIPDAIKKCITAGIKVIMITGDYSITAEAIARKAGIIPYEGKANIVTGEQLSKMSEKRLKDYLKKENLIFARTSPAQKLQIVKALQSMGEVVTVTGDGVNDAPALKNADMGVSMGIIGTEVAREASDMVLMDDNFATIVNAVEEGRTIFENIKKFIAYILTSNIPEITPFIAFVLLDIPLPLTVILILSIDLGTDLVPALGLGSENPEVDVMQNKPRSRKERLLTGKLLFMSYGIVGMLQAAAGFFSYFYVLFSNGWTWGTELASTNPIYQKAITAFFASIVICQVADVYICRTRRQSVFSAGFFSNKLIILGIFTELALLSVMVFLPAANTFFGTAPLTLFELSLSVPFALLIFFGDEFRKWLLRKDNEFVKKYLTW